MSQIIYKNDTAILSFGYKDTLSSLTNQINEHNVEEDTLLLKWLEDNSTSGKQDINIYAEDDQEGEEYVSRIVYVIKDLLSDKKGNIHCKKCDRDIMSSEIKKEQSSPFDLYRGIDKKTIKGLKKELGIKGRVKLPGGTGGTTFFCDKGHELYATKGWII